MLMGLSLPALPSKASCLFKEDRHSIHIKQLAEHELGVRAPSSRQVSAWCGVEREALKNGDGRRRDGWVGWTGEQEKADAPAPRQCPIWLERRPPRQKTKSLRLQSVEPGPREHRKGEDLRTPWVGVLEEVGFRLGLQADSYPKGTHI